MDLNEGPHKAVITPQVRVFDTREIEVDQNLSSYKMNLLHPKTKRNITMEILKDLLKTTEDSPEELLEDLEKIRREETISYC